MAEQELSHHFLLLQILGMWAPKFDNMLSYGLYYCWRTFVILIMTIFFISEIIDLCLQRNVEGMTSNFLMSTVMLCSLLKVGTFLLKRREVIDMLDLLELPFCLPRNATEHKILNKYRRHARLIGACFLLLSFLTFLLQIGIPLFYGQGIKRRILPYNTWQPYSIEDIVPYALTYFALILHGCIGMPVTVAMDCFISGLMVVTCSHLEILGARLGRLQTPDDLKICLRHHKIILRFAERIGELFGPVLFIQFLLSMINICSVIFVTFEAESKARFVVSFFFLACMMVQLLFYCWNGNEVFLKSQSLTGASLDNPNWITLPIQLKKAALLIMIRTQKPVEIKAGWLLTFSLETFMMIVKSSYSAFNLLRNTSKD